MHTTTAVDSGYKNVSLSMLKESSTNPRRTFDLAKLTELAQSLATHGLVQPITVRPKGETFEIVAGARRFRAAQIAELAEVPVRILALSDEETLEVQIIENSQRQDVHPYEEASAYQRLLDLPGYSVDTLVSKTGRSQSHIYARLALLQLVPEVATAFQENRITASHANLIARLPTAQQASAFEHCWRKDYQDTEAHLLPAKNVSSWIQANLYLPLASAPFSREALVNLDPYSFADDLAVEVNGDAQDDRRSADEVLTTAIDGLGDVELTTFAIRLALSGHRGIPRENEIDHLSEAEAAFAPKLAALTLMKGSTKKNAPPTQKAKRKA